MFFRVSVNTTEYQILYQKLVKVIAMSNNSKVFLQLIVITLLSDKKYLTKPSENAYQRIFKMICLCVHIAMTWGLNIY